MRQWENRGYREDRAMRYLFSTLIALLAAPAVAEPACALRAVVMMALAEKYGEERVALGVNSAGNLIEMLGNEETGTWTIIVTSPQGVTCLVMDGSAFAVQAGVAKDGDPT
jgi:hypothetical protein